MTVKDDVLQGRIPIHAIEKHVPSAEEAASIRREVISEKTGVTLDGITGLHSSFYEAVHGACCENVMGVITLPIGVAGPLLVDGRPAWLPLATAEGALVASISRGCKVLTQAGGVQTVITKRGMSRGVVFEVSSLHEAFQAKEWIEDNLAVLQPIFNGDSRHCRLQSVRAWMAGGSLLYARFVAQTGQAMGMNMVTKGAEQVSRHLCERFPSMSLLSVSGNLCMDKKTAHLNWLEGRGYSCVAEARIPTEIIERILHVTPEQLVKVAHGKNLIGSIMAGAAPHGCNAHAANMIAALFLACGQDAAQIVESSACLTLVDLTPEGIIISCTMPSIEIGTVGGGTRLSAQADAIKLITGNDTNNVDRMASVMIAGVMAGELSLLASLAEGSLMKAHLTLNRK